MSITVPEANLPQLYRHSRRPQWGAALLIRKDDRQATYQFQDGRQRTFRLEFSSMFEPIEAPASGLVQLIRAQNAEAARRSPSPPPMTFAQQIQVFRTLYPGEFADPKYLATWRGQPDRKLKQHLNRSIVRAAELLNKARMTELLSRDAHDEVVADLIAVLAGTTLVSSSREVKAFREMDEDGHPALAQALFSRLHDDTPLQQRIQNWVTALGLLDLPSTWATVTVPEVLLHPATGIFVRARPLQDQAHILDISGAPGSMPSSGGYNRALKTTLKTVEVLKKAGLAPNDHLDVYAFIWETLRPQSRPILAAIKAG